MFDTGEGNQSLVIPVHWFNHWALLIADRDQGLIYYMDLMETAERRQMAVASLQNI